MLPQPKVLPLLEKINSGQIQSFASGGMVGNNPWSSALNSKLSQDVKTNAILQKIAENTGISVKIADEDLKENQN